MAHRAISQAYKHIEQLDFSPHDRYLPDRWTGRIDLRWRISREHPVILGAGRMVLVESRSPGDRRYSNTPQRVAVADIVRSGSQGLPVLPGSAQKGAVRSIYELLSPSCQLAACRIVDSDPRPRLCPACSFFGTTGLAGRVRFGEALPEANGWQLERPWVPTAWPPRKSRPKTLKVYDRQEAMNRPKGRSPQPARKTERSWGVSGNFRSRLYLMNASDEEIGLLFGALGLGARYPMMRLGGKKFDGYGGVDLELIRIHQSHPPSLTLSADQIEPWSRDLLKRAVFDHSERERTWKALHTIQGRGH